MASRSLGWGRGFPDRSSRPRPVTFPSFFTCLTFAGCVLPHFSVPSGGNGGGSNGSGEDQSLVLDMFATSQGNLQSPSSLDSSSSMKRNSSLEAERRNALCRKKDRSNAITKNYGNLYQSNLPEGVASSSEIDPATRGLLGFIFTAADKFIVYFITLVMISWTYRHDPTAKQRSDEEKYMCTGTITAALVSIGVAAFASKFKDSESTNHIGFKIFIWILFFEIVAAITLSCSALHIVVQASYGVVLPLGIALFFCIVLIWVFCLERPKFLNEWTKDMWWKLTRGMPGPLG